MFALIDNRAYTNLIIEQAQKRPYITVFLYILPVYYVTRTHNGNSKGTI